MGSTLLLSGGASTLRAETCGGHTQLSGRHLARSPCHTLVCHMIFCMYILCRLVWRVRISLPERPRSAARPERCTCLTRRGPRLPSSPWVRPDWSQPPSSAGSPSALPPPRLHPALVRSRLRRPHPANSSCKQGTPPRTTPWHRAPWRLNILRSLRPRPLQPLRRSRRAQGRSGLDRRALWKQAGPDCRSVLDRALALFSSRWNLVAPSGRPPPRAWRSGEARSASSEAPPPRPTISGPTTRCSPALAA